MNSLSSLLILSSNISKSKLKIWLNNSEANAGLASLLCSQKEKMTRNIKNEYINKLKRRIIYRRSGSITFLGNPQSLKISLRESIIRRNTPLKSILNHLRRWITNLASSTSLIRVRNLKKAKGQWISIGKLELRNFKITIPANGNNCIV